ncbi:MAG: hypothetical protein DBX61_00955, partial [Clostridiales bacterium]
ATETVAPGINIATGTNELATFDDETQKNNFSQENYSSISIVENPVSIVDGLTPIDPDGTYGNVLQYHREPVPNHWSNVKFNHPLDAARRYYFTWDMFINMDGIKTVWGAVTYIGGSDKHQGVTTKANEWVNNAFSYTPNNDYNFIFRHRVGTVEAEDGAAANPLNTYIDNFGIYPYYKITYVMPDGTTQTEDYLLDENGDLAEKYIVKTDNLPGTVISDGKVMTPIGWATTSGSEVAISEVQLENKDIVLYPVYETTTYLSSPSNYMKADESITLTATEAVTWDVNVGYSNAAYTIDSSTSLTITAAGYNGAVEVSAKLVNNPEITVRKTINIIGSTKYAPGLNLLTGTEDAFTFENLSATEHRYVFNGFEPSSNLNKSGTNFSDSVVKIVGGEYPGLWTNPFDPISTERPLAFWYDYYGEFNNHWIMINGSDAKDVFTDMVFKGYNSSGVWKKAFYAGTSDAENKYENVTNLCIEASLNADDPTHALYVDNIVIMPFYKVTYMDFDGEVAATDYILLNEAGEIMTSFIPDTSKVDGATGFSLTNGGERVLTVSLEKEDITLYPVTSEEVVFVSSSDAKAKTVDRGSDFVIPTAEELGLGNAENFIVWLDTNDKKYYPGDVIPMAELDSIIGKTLEAYCQDASVPAMGYAFEGTTYTTKPQSMNYTEAIEDDGRTVIHAVQYDMWNPGAKHWVNDSRMFMKTDSPFDPKEYSIVQYMVKMQEAQDVPSKYYSDENYDPATYAEQPIDKSEAQFALWYYAPNVNGVGHNFYNTPSGENKIIGGNITMPVDGAYHMFEYDMKNTGSNSNCPYIDCETVAGFALDPNTSTWSADTYIDYIRAYRSGIFTVTYDTNAPDEYSIVDKNVAPDTGRGVGTGYLLKGERPEIDGYIFRGWALTPDAKAADVVDSVDLKGDLTVYAVWEEALYNTAPDMEDTASIRSGEDGYNGIRFRSVIDANTKEFMDEYGFIVAREDVLGDKELTFQFKDEADGSPLYVTGVAYNKDEGIDIQYSVEPDGDTVFTAVCVGIPEAHFSTEIVARAYAKYSNNNGPSFTVYGSTVTRSIAQVAQDIKKAGGDDYANNKEYIDHILETVGAQG